MWRTTPYYYAIFALIIYANVCYGCNDPLVEEKVYYSDAFAYGRVRELYPGNRSRDTKYTAEVEIYCTFKGGPLPQIINLSVPDYDSDPCVSYSFSPGVSYLLYLDATDGVYRPFFNEEEITLTEELDYIPFLCDVKIDYPAGVNVNNATETCPEPYDNPDDCTRYDPDYDNTYYPIESDYYDQFPSTGSLDWTLEPTSSTQQTMASTTPVSAAAAMNIILGNVAGMAFLSTNLCL